MKTVFHPADSRGMSRYGWLTSYHTFSFGEYYDPSRMHFGVLRVLNDDTVAGGKGFDTHPHSNMEIITLPLEGAVEHRDSIGNSGIIRAGDIQVMSAGTGVYHSEYNPSPNQSGQFLQIWLFPREKQVKPRYQQMALPESKTGRFAQILSPSEEDEGVWIHQDAWFHLGTFPKGSEAEYRMRNPENGVYVFLINGMIETAGIRMQARDGLGVEKLAALSFRMEAEARILLMEVPMH